MEPLKKTDLRPGLQVGEWTLLDGPLLAQKGRVAHRYWSCQCGCGRSKLISEWSLRYGQSSRCRSCANKAREAAGLLALGKLRKRMQGLSWEHLQELEGLVAAELARRALATGAAAPKADKGLGTRLHEDFAQLGGVELPAGLTPPSQSPGR